MSAFDTLFAAIAHPSLLSTFGEAFTYEPRQYDSYAITATASTPRPEESVGPVRFIRVWAPIASFVPGPPMKGDRITRLSDSSVYSVFEVHEGADASYELTCRFEVSLAES